MSQDVKVDPVTGLIEEVSVTLETKPQTQDIPTVSNVDKEQREYKKEEISEEVDAKRAEIELTKGYRVVDVPPYGELHIHKPTIDDDYAADLAYAKEVSRLMDNDPDIPTTEEMELKLEKRGAWTKVDEETLSDLRGEVVEIQTKIVLAKMEYKSSSKLDVKTKISELTKEYEKIRLVFLKKQATRSRFMSLTLEGRADEKRLIVKMSHCVKYPNGKRVWKTPEDLKKEKDSEPVGRLVFEFITFTQGVDPRVLEQIPDLLNEIGEIAI